MHSKIKYYLHLNGINDFSKYSLANLGGGEFISSWGYDIPAPSAGDIAAIDDADANAYANLLQRQAFITKCQPYFQQMAIYRATLRKHFGDGAETNREVTQAAVATYFETKRMMGTITAVESADALSLITGFETLAPLVGAEPPNTWDLPWEVLP